MAQESFIRRLRKDAGLTQDAVAKKLGVARTTYTAIETGQGELSLSEIKKLSVLYQIPPGDIVEGRLSEDVVYHASTLRESTQDFYHAGDADVVPRELDPEANPVKLRNVLLYVTERIGARPNVGETVLYKLLYFIDFDFYEKTGRSVTGLTYIKNHFGPTPNYCFADIVKGMVEAGDLEIAETPYFAHTQKKYLPVAHPDLSGLTAEEIKHIDAELERLGDKTAAELTAFSHKDTPWIAAKPKTPISYQHAMYRTDATTVREATDEL
ncbi:MAG: DUF4065 domain-containing protein [Clostridiales Family XIII bacterium]|jgi:transcriptional regulator with XRE-family HTH domain|nr:DUF4065 domain-containing protein [Clostridiales Family XIII bacterium]